MTCMIDQFNNFKIENNILNFFGVRVSLCCDLSLRKIMVIVLSSQSKVFPIFFGLKTSIWPAKYFYFQNLKDHSQPPHCFLLNQFNLQLCVIIRLLLFKIQGLLCSNDLKKFMLIFSELLALSFLTNQQKLQILQMVYLNTAHFFH